MSTRENDFDHIKELGKSKFEIAEGDSDIRGWTVKNENGNILGEVHDLLFDTEAKRVLYIVLDMEGNELNLKDRKVLVPIEIADLHEGYKNVILPGGMANELTAIPTYERGKLNTKTVDFLVHSFANLSTRGTQKANVSQAQPSDISEKTGGFNTHSYNEETHASSQAQPSNILETDGSNPRKDDHLKGDKTVIGVYEHTNLAQAAVEYLSKYGFKSDNMSISARSADEDNNKGITGFFRSLFQDDDEVHKYSEAARTGAVVTVNAFSDKEAEEAAEILDQHGAINMNDKNKVSEKYNSRILVRGSGNIAT
ncbi:MAG TPA: PRC-barrel domain-containing protein [Sphingobacteriaceae bacterium]|nr:PRC-barrel domain-containing protein [Sphingobacteriaceae bacterium]